MVIMTEPKWWDFTAKDEGTTPQEVIDLCESLNCDRYAFGREVGEGGYEHYQGRLVLKVGKDLKTLANWNKEHGVSWHWSPTHVRDFTYVEKEGLFYRSWEKNLSRYSLLSLRPWQGEVIASIKGQDNRCVDVILDGDGGIGKTTLAKYMVANHMATYVPPFNDAQDYMAFAMAKPSDCYIIDLPRAEDTKKARGLWSAVEQIKNGYVYDKRYNFRDAWIGEPKVLVFTNELPDKTSLSADRWRLYYVMDEHLYRCTGAPEYLRGYEQ